MNMEPVKSIEKIRETVRHKMHVLDACILLGERLIEQGEDDLGRSLIAHGFAHDCSKFFGIEYDFLSKYEGEDRSQIALAVKHHNRTNQHHPEYWGSIKNMPPIYLCEMICDWKARSVEFGSSLTDWIEKEAKKKFKFTRRDKVYSDIMRYVSLLLDKKFEPLPEKAN